MDDQTKSTQARAQSVKFLLKGDTKSDRLTTKALANPGCDHHKCMGSIMRPRQDRPPHSPKPKDELLSEAEDFIVEYYEHINQKDSEECAERLRGVVNSINTTGTYDVTTDELSFGVKTAWRNAPRCIGRIQWKNIRCIDARHVRTAPEMFEMIKEQIEYANNGGNIRSCITIFPKRTDGQHDFKVWNSQLIGFAGYAEDDGSVIGDPVNVEFTEICMKLGWKGGPRTRFDILPLVLQANGEQPEVFELPKELVMIVPLSHPKYDWFAELGLQWYAVPAVANMMCDMGGIEFTAAPFNGWYMGTEVGSRDLCDSNRYNMLEEIAKEMEVDTMQNLSLWKDEVLVEVNRAVLYSFKTAGVTMVDHHTASDQFMSHLDTEYRIRGGCPADWVWVVPPLSSSITPVFHMEMLHYKLKPSFEYQVDAWNTHDWGQYKQEKRKWSMKLICKLILITSSLMQKALERRPKCAIIYATETGRSKEFAKIMKKMSASAFHVKMYCMDEYNPKDLHKESLVLIIASTFGNGDPPENGRVFYDVLQNEGAKWEHDLRNVKFAVFALGSSAYPSFCEFGHNLDLALDKLGCQRVHATGEGDELQGQEESFKEWATECFKSCCLACSLDAKHFENIKLGNSSKWGANKYRYAVEQNFRDWDLRKDLEHIHKKSVHTTSMKGSAQLQAPDSGRRTVFVNVDSNNQPNLTYRPGDHIAIFPHNNKQMVDQIIRRLPQGPSADVYYKLQTQEKTDGNNVRWRNYKRLPRVVSTRKALTHFLDINSPPSQQLLAQLAPLCTTLIDRERLDSLSTHATKYKVWRTTHVPNLLDVLCEFPSLKLAPSFLLTQLPLLQPRYYSISSSEAQYPGDIHITAAVVEYDIDGRPGVRRQGLCSTWLLARRVGDEINCFVRRNEKFHLSSQLTSPVIMVGPGTGIAPFRSFWQERYVDKIKLQKPVGPMSLYFGCRNYEKDNLFRQERKAMESHGILQNHTAVSRETGVPKTYVQDLLERDGSKIVPQLVDTEGHFYVCGDVDMADDVRITLQRIFQLHGGMTVEEAKTFLNNMRKCNRYHEDIFGTLKPPTISVVKVRRTSTLTEQEQAELAKKNAHILSNGVSKGSKGVGPAKTGISNGKSSRKSKVTQKQGKTRFSWSSR